jgi:hypothetical protein
MPNLSRDDGPDVGHLQQLLDAGAHQLVQRAEMARQVLGRRLADLAYAQ